MHRFFLQLQNLLAWTRSPRSLPGWRWLAMLSTVTVTFMVVQNLCGFPLTYKINVGPDKRIEVAREYTGAYRWHLPHSWRKSLASWRMVLLENGKPMSRTDRISDVTGYQASHYFISNSLVYFGSANGSDVRKNGKRYELVAPKVISEEWLTVALVFWVLSLTMTFRLGSPDWLRALLRSIGRVPIWVPAVLAMSVAAADLYLHPDRSHGVMLVKGLPDSDAGGWLQLATRLSEGHGLDSIFGAQRPLYAVLLAVLHMIHPSLTLSKLLNVALLGIASASVFALGRAMRAPWAGLATVIFLVLARDHLMQVHTLLTELPGLAFGTLAAALLVIALHHRSLKLTGLAGLTAGLGNICCGELLLALPLTALALVAIGWRSRMKPDFILKLAAVFTLGATLALGPWMVVQKVRFGILTFSYNSAELLAGGADPVHGKLSLEHHREAGALCLDSDRVADRYRFFSERFARHVKADPLGYFARVIRATGYSFHYLRSSDPIIRTLIGLTLLGAGLIGAPRWRSWQPLAISALLIYLAAQSMDDWSSEWLTAASLILLTRRWRGTRLTAIVMIAIIAIACIVLCGLAGNVASRRFWVVADGALVLLWLVSINHALQLLFALVARIPVLNRGMVPGPAPAVLSSSIQHTLRPLPRLGMAVAIVSLTAIGITSIRHLIGPRPYFSPEIMATLPAASPDPKDSGVALWFDDFSFTLGKGEHVPHWLPYYAPSNDARWIARPRIVFSDGSLGSRTIVRASTSEIPRPPRWQLTRCYGAPVTLHDSLSLSDIGILELHRIEPASSR